MAVAINDSTYAHLAVNIGSLIVTYIWLRYLWPSPTAEELRRSKELESKMTALRDSYLAIPAEAALDCIEGDSAGDYAAPWTETFDLTFVIIMSGSGNRTRSVDYGECADRYGSLRRSGCLSCLSSA